MRDKTKKRTLWQILVGADLFLFVVLYAGGLFVTIVLIALVPRAMDSGWEWEARMAVSFAVLGGPGLIVLAIVGHIFRWLEYRWGRWS